jgi:putative ABC transport system permease protein
MGTLNRKLRRDLWRIRGQSLAIILVIAAGVALFVMSLGTMRSLETTRDAYYERYRFADVFAHAKRVPESLAGRISRLPGVKWAETRVIVNANLDVAGMEEPAIGRIVSLPDNGILQLNGVVIRDGRNISAANPDEVLISVAFAGAHDLGPGDHLLATLNGHRRQLLITGTALSPEFVYTIAPGGLMPDDRHFGILWMGRSALAGTFDLEDAFNSVSLSLLPSADEREVIEQLDHLLEPYGGTGAFGRSEHVSDQFLANEMVQLRTMGRVAPAIFLAVAAFLLNIVVARLVATEREQIGLLKAFGYSDLAVGWHYMKMVLAIAAIGTLLGFGFGTWLGRGMTVLYTQFFQFPFLFYEAPIETYVVGGIVTMLAAALGVTNAVGRAVRLAPAVAMQAAPPPVYHRTLLDRAGPSALFGQSTRMILRHVARWPLRAGLTVVGIAMSAAIIVSTFFSVDAMDFMLDVTFNQTQRQDATITFFEPVPLAVGEEIARLPGVLDAEPFRALAVRFRLGPRERRLGIMGILPDADLSRLVDRDLEPVSLPREGLVLSSKLAEILGARRGDLVHIEIMEGRRLARTARVSAIVEEYMGVTAYMDLRALNRLAGEGPTASGVNVLIDPAHAAALFRALKDAPVVATTTLQSAAIEMFEATMQESLLIMTFALAIFGGLIAFGVVYNSARISLSERGRELASLRVLGFTRGEVSYILLGEFGLLIIVALPLGCVIGYGLAWLLAQSLDTELFRIPLIVDRATYGFAISVVLVSAALSGWMVRRRIARLDLVAVLKTRE